MSAQPLSPFLTAFGFTGDPFRSTNAEDEPLLGDYFVPPPYFESVMGDYRNPHSDVVLAPRGGGKTAQRRMIELRSVVDPSFLCLAYDNFDIPAQFSASDATLVYHLNQVCQLIVFGIFAELDRDPTLAGRLSGDEKELLKYQAKRFLGSLSAEEVEKGIKSVKNLGDKAREFLQKYGGPVNTILTALMRKAGLDDPVQLSLLPEEATRDESLRYHFRRLLGCVQKLGFASTYVLVDKIDETAVTGEASSSFAFIRPLITDLPTLEEAGVGFKLFLWDAIESSYMDGGARPDRIPTHRLNWSVPELEAMLSQRLNAYSAGAVMSLDQMLALDSGISLQRLVAYLGAGSPRDCIRLCAQMVSEQTRTSSAEGLISLKSVWAGVRGFSDQRALEVARRDVLADLKRVRLPTFTINRLANDVFRVSDQAARRKVQIWSDRGIVEKIGELPNRRNRPTYLFGVTDLRVAIAMMPTEDIPLILGNYAVLCPSCGAVCVTDRTEIDCPASGDRFKLGDARTLYDEVTT